MAKVCLVDMRALGDDVQTAAPKKDSSTNALFNGCPIPMTSSRASPFPRTWSTIAQLIICFILFAGLAVLRAKYAATIDLRVDEAYYWTWWQERALSYLD